jgi:hypothetical protein
MSSDLADETTLLVISGVLGRKSAVHNITDLLVKIHPEIR